MWTVYRISIIGEVGEMTFDEEIKVVPLQRAYRLRIIMDGIVRDANQLNLMKCQVIKDESFSVEKLDILDEASNLYLKFDARLHGLKCGIDNLIRDLESLSEVGDE